MNIAEVRRLFASVPSGPHILTTDGLVYDGIRYRHNQEGIAEVLDNNHRFTPFAKRLDEDGKVEVEIRVWDFDIDEIEILDEVTGKYHSMWSTDPEYTGGLSRWEHHHYQSYLTADGRGPRRQMGRVAAKAKQKTLRDFDDDLYKLGMRSRTVPAGLIDGEARREARLAEAASERAEEQAFIETEIAERCWEVDVGGGDRKDLPRAPSQGGRPATRKRRVHTPPKRGADYGAASTSGLTRRSNEPSPPDSSDPYRHFKRRNGND